MIERAKQIRARDSFGLVTPEDFIGYPAVKQEEYIDTENYTVHIIRFTPEGAKDHRPMFVNFHGGGFLKGRYGRDDLLCSKIASILECEVVDIDYKLAPEYQYPVAVNEAYEITEWLFRNADKWGVDTKRVILSGQSSGGNLVSTIALRSGESKYIKPCGIIIGWAPLDLYTDPANKPRVEGDMPPERARLYNSFYCNPMEAKDQLVSPLFADECNLKYFPKTLIISAGQDSLAAEDEAFAARLIKAGIDVRARRFMNSKHGFLTNRMDEWEEAMELLVQFSKEAFRLL